MDSSMVKKVRYVSKESSEFILVYDDLYTIVLSINEKKAVHMVWRKLHEILLVNNSTRNSQGLSILMGFLFIIKEI